MKKKLFFTLQVNNKTSLKNKRRKHEKKRRNGEKKARETLLFPSGLYNVAAVNISLVSFKILIYKCCNYFSFEKHLFFRNFKLFLSFLSFSNVIQNLFILNLIMSWQCAHENFFKWGVVNLGVLKANRYTRHICDSRPYLLHGPLPTLYCYSQHFLILLLSPYLRRDQHALNCHERDESERGNREKQPMVE